MHADIITVPAGAEGIDYAWWRPTVDELAKWVFAVRYACKLPNGKAASTGEVVTIHGAGTAFALVWEQGAADWQQGSAKGAEHGPLAAKFAAALGYPKGLPIMFAFDTNAAPGDARARAYGAAAADAVEAAGYAFGIYGDLDVILVLQDRSRLNWLAGATSWSDPTKPYQPETMPGYELCHVRQVISGSTPNYDRNITLRPFPAWLPHDAPDVEVEPPVAQPVPLPPAPYDPEVDMPANPHPFRIRGFNEVCILPGALWVTGPMLAAFNEAPTVVDDEPAVRLAFARAGVPDLTPTADGK